MLVEATRYLADPETAAMAAAMAARQQPLDVENLAQLTGRILDGDDDMLIGPLIIYCGTQGIMFDTSEHNRLHPKSYIEIVPPVTGLRKLLAQMRETVLGVFQGQGKKEDTIT